MPTLPVPSRSGELALPGLTVAAVLAFVAYLVAFDQGLLLAPLTDAMRDSGGMLHEFFHDSRHLLGVPCH